jgi:hypothetical protein
MSKGSGRRTTVEIRPREGKLMKNQMKKGIARPEGFSFITIGESKPDEIRYFPKSGKARIRSTGGV